MKKAKKTKKAKQKIFEIRLNEFQAHLISEALDNYMLLLTGQFDNAIDNIRFRFFSKNIITYHEEVKRLISQLKWVIFDGKLLDSASYGIGWQGIPIINDMYEMYKMINKALWESMDDESKNIMSYSVDRQGVIVKYSKQPLIEVREIKNKETKNGTT